MRTLNEYELEYISGGEEGETGGETVGILDRSFSGISFGIFQGSLRSVIIGSVDGAGFLMSMGGKLGGGGGWIAGGVSQLVGIVVGPIVGLVLGGVFGALCDLETVTNFHKDWTAYFGS